MTRITGCFVTFFVAITPVACQSQDAIDLIVEAFLPMALIAEEGSATVF